MTTFGCFRRPFLQQNRFNSIVFFLLSATVRFLTVRFFQNPDLTVRFFLDRQIFCMCKMKNFPPYLIVVEPVLQTKTPRSASHWFSISRYIPGTFESPNRQSAYFHAYTQLVFRTGVRQGFSPNLMQHTDQKWGKASMNETYRSFGSIFESFGRLTRCECESTYYQ